MGNSESIVVHPCCDVELAARNLLLSHSYFHPIVCSETMATVLYDFIASMSSSDNVTTSVMCDRSCYPSHCKFFSRDPRAETRDRDPYARSASSTYSSSATPYTQYETSRPKEAPGELTVPIALRGFRNTTAKGDKLIM